MKLLIILFLLPVQLLSQDITGIWTGFMQTRGNDVPYELVIGEINGKLTGYSLTIFTINGIENMGVKSIVLKKKNGRIIIEDDELVFNNYSTPPRRIKLFGTLFLRVEDTVLRLSGEFKTRAMDFRSQENNFYTGTISLQRQNALDRTRLIRKLDELNLLNSLSIVQQKIKEKQEESTVAVPAEIIEPPLSNEKETDLQPVSIKDSLLVAKPKKDIIVTPRLSPIQKSVEVPKQAAAEVATRKKEIIRSVPFKSDSLVLTLYDHGIEDGDTVSVVLNDNVIIGNLRLTNKPKRIVVPITPDLGDSLVLIMYAENLGTIPPNTGVLYIQDADTRYEIRFSGDMKMSSAIILKREH